MRGTKGPYGYKFVLDDRNWLSLASWNHVHDAAPESEPNENVEIGLYNGTLTCWRLDVKDVGELLVVWGRGNYVETVEYLEQHGVHQLTAAGSGVYERSHRTHNRI